MIMETFTDNNDKNTILKKFVVVFFFFFKEQPFQDPGESLGKEEDLLSKTATGKGKN